MPILYFSSHHTKCTIYNRYDFNILQFPKYYEFNFKLSFLHFYLALLFISKNHCMSMHIPLCKLLQNYLRITHPGQPVWYASYLFCARCLHFYYPVFSFIFCSRKLTFATWTLSTTHHHQYSQRCQAQTYLIISRTCISSNLAFRYFVNWASYYGQ